ncbi:(deoxy)nucleoside triphosphate pyrophosphohydrolase [Texcoconibacillus texcoconensis]|uniref:8-oxo-dGTP diphosphatase n=1 Tax=Texcoconibacillus texcoconensis TaxID=1095777 RepID=A0A840QRQ7_9BACI|nr:(deoxy)nucleoside triphosphate pyrophosphohydrolase [Texcoconibacillus texcoconensis]MBB5174029.1 8-oxo-dGTP diphosphatase [Texcoconibacillus texcoconensis]
MKRVNVVAAVIFNEEKQVLCAKRATNMSHPNLWEFPGGKIKEHETPEEALKREIQEELTCSVEINDPIHKTEYQYPDIFVHLQTFQTKIIEGTPQAKVHEQLAWVAIEELKKLNWAPADLPTVHKLIRQANTKS